MWWMGRKTGCIFRSTICELIKIAPNEISLSSSSASYSSYSELTFER